MLYYLFVTVFALVCILLIIVILLQQGKGGDIANAFAISPPFPCCSRITMMSSTQTIANTDTIR